MNSADWTQISGKTALVLTLSGGTPCDQRDILPLGEPIEFVAFARTPRQLNNNSVAFRTKRTYNRKYGRATYQEYIWLIYIEGGNCHGWTFRSITESNVTNELLNGCYNHATVGHINWNSFGPASGTYEAHTQFGRWHSADALLTLS